MWLCFLIFLHSITGIASWPAEGEFAPGSITFPLDGARWMEQLNKREALSWGHFKPSAVHRRLIFVLIALAVGVAIAQCYTSFRDHWIDSHYIPRRRRLASGGKRRCTVRRRLGEGKGLQRKKHAQHTVIALASSNTIHKRAQNPGQVTCCI